MQHRHTLAFSTFLILAFAAGGCASGTPGTRDAQTGEDGGGTDGSTGPEDAGPPCEESAECDDGDPCNGVETCVSARCVRGVAIDCDDGVSCTDDTCDPADGSCSHLPDHGACSADLVCDPDEGCTAPAPCTTDEDCDDGLFCNGVETCDAAFGCRPGAAPACDDGVACTTDTCDPLADGGAGACAHANDSAACSDGRVCNGVETCDPTSAMADATGCVPGAEPDCDDGVACTVDACDEGEGGCFSTPDHVSCSDGVFCNGAEICGATGCGPGAPPTCDDSIGCTTGRCDVATDACVQDPDTASCQDGLVCNGTEQCDVTGVTPGTGCVSGAPVNCSDGLACTTDICNEPGGTCTHGGSDADGDGHTALGCGAGDDCNDLSAAIHPGATELCDGVDNDCSGAADDGSGMECAVGSGARTCTTSCGTAGSRTCTAACTLTACVAAAETCNDCDDDGDGLIDDGLPCRRGTTSACTTTCGTSGSRTCASDCSGYSTCVAPTEACNDCDDDGDGTIDEGLPCRRGTSASCTTSCGTVGTRVCALDCSGYGSCRAASETCNGCDDDGNGLADDGFACRQGATMSCTTACGTAGVRTCAADCSGFGACVATEVCNGCDDDGDGTTDEGFTCAMGSSRSCTTGCGTTGTQACNGTCSGYGACTASEACNGCDDDGDGSADEDFACRQGATMGCTTSCGTAGTRTCSATCSGFGACSATEICNGCDDDGVGGADNGFACVQGSSRSCTTSCGTTGTESCNGTCSGYGACSATEVCNGCDDDADGAPDDGFACVQGASRSCTTSCGTTGTESCNGTCSGYGACSATEVCNGCDDDADGAPDDGFTCVQGASSACTTTCGTAGSRTCNGSCTGYSTCVAPAEVCGNGCDDDGDGMTDEGCTVAPPNDTCGGAILLSGASGTRSDSFDGATATVSDCASGREVWYRISVSARSILYLDTFGSSFDTKISVRSACGSSYLQCEDDDCSVAQDQLVREVTAGTYYVAVHAFSSATTTGTVNLRWQTLPTGSGTAARITGNGTYSGTTSGTGITSSCTGSGPENVHYFTLCPATSRTVTASTCSLASFDTVLYLRSGTGVDVVCNDDACGVQSSISGAISGPGLWGVFVDGWGGASGSYSVSVSGL